MAPGLRRWVLLVVVGCAVATIGLLPQPTFHDRDRELKPSGRSHRLRRSIVRTYRWLSWVQVGDTLSRMLADSLATGREGPFQIEPSGVPLDGRRVIGRSLDLTLDAMPGSARMPIALAVVIDTIARRSGLNLGGANGLVHYTPESMDGQTCVATIITRAPRALRYLYRSPEEIPGLCAYFWAFGAPGRGVGSWLDANDYAFARNPSWLVRDEQEPVTFADRGYWPASWVRFAPGLFACAQEDLQSCRRLLLADFARGRSVNAPEGIYGRFLPQHPFGVGARELLSDLLLDIGPDRFVRFWSSEAEVEEAFRSAVGLPMERWATRWARRKLKYDPHRAMPSPGSFAMGLTLSAILVLGTAMWVRRRQVG